MTTLELRNLDRGALLTQIKTLQQEFFMAQESNRTGKEKNHALLKGMRRNIARAKTILREKQA